MNTFYRKSRLFGLFQVGNSLTKIGVSLTKFGNNNGFLFSSHWRQQGAVFDRFHRCVVFHYYTNVAEVL